MKKAELEKEMKMKYLELCDYLKEKYGKVPYDYFLTENCKSKNTKNTRGNEGLFIHHIKESEAVMLGNPLYAVKFPFQYQRNDNLVYCNYLEHYLLHYKIVEEFFNYNKVMETRCFVGIGGIVNYIAKEINDFYNGYTYAREWQKTAFSLIDENFDDYVELLKKSVDLFKEDRIIDTLKGPDREMYHSVIHFLDIPYQGKMIHGPGKFEKAFLRREGENTLEVALQRIRESKVGNFYLNKRNVNLWSLLSLDYHREIDLIIDESEEKEFFNRLEKEYKLFNNKYYPIAIKISFMPTEKKYKKTRYNITYDGRRVGDPLTESDIRKIFEIDKNVDLNNHNIVR